MLKVGRGGGGHVVSVLAFHLNDPSSIPAEAYSFFSVKFVFEKNEYKRKEAGEGPLKTLLKVSEGRKIVLQN